MRFGVVILPEHRWPEAAPRWRRAEALGFAHGWTYDHLAWRSLRDRPWFGALPTLGAAALVTERMRLGTLVASPNFRHPVALAKEVMTLDDISAGRLTLGLGAGGTGWDATMLGQSPLSPAERADRFDEFVELTDLLLRQAETSYAGRVFRADGARCHPGCLQRPRVPFAVAATGPRGMRLAARLGQAWVTFGDLATTDMLDGTSGARVVAGQLARLEEACAAVGRDPRTLERIVLTGPTLDPGLSSVERFRDTAGHYEALGITELVVHWPRPDAPYAADMAVFEAAFSP